MAEQLDQIGGIDNAVAVEIGRPARIGSPGAEQHDEVAGADVAVAMRLRRNPYKSDRIEFRNRHDDCIDRAFVGDHE